MKSILAVVILSGAIAWSQAGTQKAQTSASCSPAVVGNNNRITMTCGGISKAKADELIHLMNGILSREIDPKLVYSQLDAIQKEMKSIRTAFADPLADTPPAELDLWHAAQRLQQKCGNFVIKWNQDLNQAFQDFNQKQLEAVQNRTAMPAFPNQAEMNRVESESFNTNLLPELDRVRKQLAPKVPDYAADSVDYSGVKNNQQAASVCSDFGRLTVNYQVVLYQEGQKQQLSK